MILKQSKFVRLVVTVLAAAAPPPPPPLTAVVIVEVIVVRFEVDYKHYCDLRLFYQQTIPLNGSCGPQSTTN